MVYFMIYRICHCVTTQCGKRVVINTMYRQKNARTRVHLCTIRRKLRMLLRPSSMFLKDAIRFCASNRFVRRNVLRARTRVRASADVWTKNGLVRFTAERKSEQESHRKRDSMKQKGWSVSATNSFLSKVAAVLTIMAISTFESQ